MVEIPAAAEGGSAPSAGSKGACLRRFGEWWTPSEMRAMLGEVSPAVAEMLDAHGGGIDDAERLSEVLYTCVGPHFLRNIDGDPDKRQRFVGHVLDAAAKRGDVDEDDVIDMAWKAHGRRFHSLGEVAGSRVSEGWCLALARKLGLPPSTARKARRQRPPDTEIVEPHSQLNPLYDYQYTAGLLVRGMLEGTRAGRDGRPIKRRLIAVPTGSGKTRMVVETLIEWLNDGKPSRNEQQSGSKFVVWVAQTEELCDQAWSSFRDVFKALGKRGTTLRLHRLWGDHGRLPPMEMADLLDERGIIVATMQSLDKVLKNDPEQLDRLARLTSCIVIDEAHHSTARSYSDVLRRMHFNWDNRKREISELGIVLIGLTATPFRGTGEDTERAQLKRRYGDVVYPDIPHYGGAGNQRPHALVDCQPSAYAGDHVRILGERSYDRDGYIRDDGYAWTIEKTGSFIDRYRDAADSRPRSPARGVNGRKNIVEQFREPGEYKITLTVTDNEGDTGDASAYLRIRERPADEDGGGAGAATEVQKRLYHRLIKRKILCDVYHKVLPSEGIRLTARDVEHMRQFGEFGLDTIKGVGNIPGRNRLILDEIRKMRDLGRRKILFFGCSVEHSRLIAVLLKALHGMRAAYVDSRTSADARADAIERFRSGDLEVLCNYGVLTAGFDAPNIDCVFVGRPVRSTLLYTQMIGRGMRGTKSGGTENVVIIDIDDNFQLGYGQEESLAEVGWMVYQEYWKTWDDGAGGGGEPHEAGSGAPASVSCPSCGRTATGSEEMLDVFGAEPRGGGTGGPDEPAPHGPALCKDCATSGGGAEYGQAEDEAAGTSPALGKPGGRDQSAARELHPVIQREFDFLRDKELGHIPTSRQFAAGAHPDAIAAAERLYGGYGGYLESRGMAVRGDPFLEDALYDNYFALYSQAKKAPSEQDLDARGRYAAEEYAECFGSYEGFRSAADEIIGRMSNLDPGIARADLFRDYRRMRGELGRRPHFGEMRLLSQAGVEYYLGLFGSVSGFESAEEHDRVEALREVEFECRRLRDLLGAVPNARQLEDYSRSGARLRNLYPGMDADDAYSEFVRYAGMDGAPVRDPIPDRVRAGMRRRTMQKFMDSILARHRPAGGGAAAGQGARGAAGTPDKKSVLEALGGDDPFLADSIRMLRIKKSVLEALGGDDPAPYNEWFGSAGEFAAALAEYLIADDETADDSDLAGYPPPT